jgi:hypothetical protein
MLIFSEIGRRIGIARLAHDPEGLTKGAGAAEAAVFGLLGLLIAFTFSGAASRFEDRRDLIAAESNAIGTAYLRIDLLPGDAQPDIGALFRRYADARLATYRDVADQTATQAKLLGDQDNGFKSLEEAQRVTFGVVTGPKGLRATNIRPRYPMESRHKSDAVTWLRLNLPHHQGGT